MLSLDIQKQDIDQEDVGSVLIQHITQSRFRQKKNTFFAICGGMGEGKSYVALRIAEIIQPDFNCAEQVVYLPTQFFAVINMAKEKGYKVIVLDEAHTTVNARQWFNFINIAISMVASTFRQIKNLVIIIVTPSINWVEKNIREMIDYYGVVYRKEDSSAHLKLYEVGLNRYDLRDQSPFLKKIVFYYKGRVCKLKQIEVGLPSKRIIDEYEPLATAYKTNLLKKKMEEVVKMIGMSNDKDEKFLETIAVDLLNNPKLLKRVSVKSKSNQNIKLRKGDIKTLYKLDDKEIFDLEGKLSDKLEAA